MKGYKLLFPRILIALVLVTGLVGLAVQPAQAATTNKVDCKQWHTVKYEETLVSIARKYDTSWRKVAELNSLTDPYKLYVGQKLCVSGTIIPEKPVSPVPGGAVRVYAIKVREDQNVTLNGVSLQPKAFYSVYLSQFKGVAPTRFKVGSIQADQNGSFSQVFTLPAKLKDISKIRVQLNNGRGDAPENWFINANVQGNTGGYAAPKMKISIEAVQKGSDVSIKAMNIPGNVTFKVYIGNPGTSLTRMEQAGTLRINTAKGGTVKASYLIPAKFSSSQTLEIRLVNHSLDMAAAKTFSNKTQ